LAIAGLKNLIVFVVVRLFTKPLLVVARGVSRFVMLPMYKRYIPVKFLIRKKTSASKSVLYPLMTRSALHAVIGIITFAVVAQSVLARGVAQDQVGQKSVLGVLALNQGSEEGADIVETADGPSHLPTHYAARGGVLAASAATIEEAPEEIIIEPSVSAAGVLKSDGALGSTERQSVESYIVQGGDTISTIAEKFSVSIRTILWANNLSDTSVIRPGDTLQIPPVTGVIHQVKAGDTVDKIANKYKAQANDIMAFNQLPTKEAIEVGDVLIVPGGIIEQAPAASTPTTPVRNNFIDRIFRGPIPPPAKVAPSNRLLWPTPNRKINQYYRGFLHTGLDIEGTYSSPIYAAADGRVESVIYQRFGYGYHIIINHGGGRQTLYAHASKMFVKPGQHVNRGQTIAIVGSTGRSTGTHLHFEVIVNGRKTNPLANF
jgi:murein DD-endopeptidase MepM/ murein hydrolase activator NlpD